MWVLNVLPSCLSWIRFALCHGLGSSCRTDALQFCLLDLLHKGLCSALTGSRWLVERKKPHVFVFFFTVYRFLWHTDCSWMCKKAGLEVSMQPAIPYHSDTNTDAPGLVLSPELGDAQTLACGQAWLAYNLCSLTLLPWLLTPLKAVDHVGVSGSLPC